MKLPLLEVIVKLFPSVSRSVLPSAETYPIPAVSIKNSRNDAENEAIEELKKAMSLQASSLQNEYHERRSSLETAPKHKILNEYVRMRMRIRAKPPGASGTHKVKFRSRAN